MKQIEITSNLDLTDEQMGLLDMHSFLNLMNILIGEMYVIETSFGSQPGFTMAMQIAERIKDDLGDIESIKLHINQVDELSEQIFEGLSEGLVASNVDDSNPDVKESLENIHSVLEIMKVRSLEILARLEEPDKWVGHNIKDLKQNFMDVLAAIEKNSKGRYYIVYNIASKDHTDYIVDLNIESVDNEVIYIPPVLQDVLRDIIANARKYSDPGGRISAGLIDNGEFLRIVVKDEGRGIPEEEIVDVVNYGKRASNVGDKATKGGGFGLTKAYFITRQFGGRMWISSEQGKGTMISIHIPVKNRIL